LENSRALDVCGEKAHSPNHTGGIRHKYSQPCVNQTCVSMLIIKQTKLSYTLKKVTR